MQQVETAAYAKQLEGFQEGQQRAVGRGERERERQGSDWQALWFRKESTLDP